MESAVRETQEEGRVNILPTELANQIAAGEVIERPAAAVKELVENSIDADATQIFVEIQDGGRQLIRVTDNGCGMNRGDAVRCLERHATSKISTVEDLFSISTLGFRGEALPSIASVSRFTLMSQEHEALSGTRIEVEGGHVTSIRDAGLPAGTVIEVRDLFFNTPARLKFLKTTPTEVRHISETLLRIALANPAIHIRLVHNGRKTLDLPPNTSLGDRVYAIFGSETREALFDTFDYPPILGVTASGFYSRPDFNQRTTNQFYVFVNGRFVKNSTVSAAIKSSYRGMMEKNRYPMVIIFLDVPADLVDVNVHPTKIEVRFTKSDAVFRAVYHAIHDALQETPWVDDVQRTYTLKLQEQKNKAGAVGPDQISVDPLDARQARQSNLLDVRDRRPTEPIRIPIADLFGAPPPSRQRPASQPAPSPTPTPAPAAAPVSAPTPTERAAADLNQALGPRTFHIGPEPGAGASELDDEEVSVGYFSRLNFIGQYRRLYLVCEDASGLVIVDQHAAHERIGFERLRHQYRDNTSDSQALLFPERLSLDTLRAATLREELEFFEKLGFEIDPFGGNDFAIGAVPAMLVGADYGRMIKDALDDLASVGQSDRISDALDAIFARMACHSVIRAGDELGKEEARELFRQMDAIDFGANCPHGRPVYYRLPLSELEEAFGRT
ncbi:MAG: DNA mismatch repair protein MutL [Myxococcales bacterium]|nr:DNA mismatch repair protein MutL [Myxococcales bacterium]